jgi:hypothetical protein
MEEEINISELKPIDSEDSYSGYINEKYGSKRKYEIDYKNLICCDCKKNKAELIRGTSDYLCVDCFKKWLETRKNPMVGQISGPVLPGQAPWGSASQGKEKING